MRPALSGDERAIEGLPVRLVIALVVGVASLGVMMNTLGGIQTLGVSELDTQPSPEVVNTSAQNLTVAAVGPEGDRVANATIVAKSATATLESVKTAQTNASGYATLQVDPSLGPNQEEGRVELGVKPPARGGYEDDRDNTAVLVVAE